MVRAVTFDRRHVRLFRAWSGGRADRLASFVASGSAEGAVRLWDPRSMTLSTLVQAHECHVKTLVSFGHTLVSGAKDALIRVWDRRNMTAPTQTLTGHSGAVYSMSFDGVRLVSCCLGGDLRVWDFRHGGPLAHDSGF
jgi:WD40 repeat protein